MASHDRGPTENIYDFPRCPPIPTIPITPESNETASSTLHVNLEPTKHIDDIPRSQPIPTTSITSASTETVSSTFHENLEPPKSSDDRPTFQKAVHDESFDTSNTQATDDDFKSPVTKTDELLVTSELPTNHKDTDNKTEDCLGNSKCQSDKSPDYTPMDGAMSDKSPMDSEQNSKGKS
jgi:hypothetical protein